MNLTPHIKAMFLILFVLMLNIDFGRDFEPKGYGLVLVAKT